MILILKRSRKQTADKNFQKRQESQNYSKKSAQTYESENRYNLISNHGN